MAKKQSYDFKVKKNDSNIDIQDLELWITESINDKWRKQEHKHTIVYTFTTTDDALKFKLKWTFA